MPKEAPEWQAHLASGYDGAMTARCGRLLAEIVADPDRRQAILADPRDLHRELSTAAGIYTGAAEYVCTKSSAAGCHRNRQGALSLSVLRQGFVMKALELLRTPSIDHVAKLKQLTLEVLSCTTQTSPCRLDPSHQTCLFVAVLRVANLKSFEVLSLGSASIAVACRNCTECSLIVAASKQAREELRVEAFVYDFIYRKFLRDQRPIECGRDDGYTALPQVDRGEHDVSRPRREPL